MNLLTLNAVTSDPKILAQLVDFFAELLVADHVDHPAMLDDVVAIGKGRGEVEVLLHQQNGEALVLQGADNRRRSAAR